MPDEGKEARVDNRSVMPVDVPGSTRTTVGEAHRNMALSWLGLLLVIAT